MRAAVVGAGISGLAAAHRLLGAGVEVVVLEAADRPGGKILTTPFVGRPVDCAADAFLARAPEAVALCHELGLADELVAPSTSSAQLFRDGALHRLPAGLVLGVPTDLEQLGTSGLVSREGAARAAADLTSGGQPWAGDESIGSLVRRRLGDEVFEALVAPLVGGIAAGDADQLGVEANAPALASAIAHQPSLVAGLRRQLERTGDGPPAPVFYGLRSGTGRLVEALARAIGSAGGTVSLGARATRLREARRQGRASGGSRYEVLLEGGGAVGADAVVVATPSFAGAGLLEGLAPAVAGELGETAYASVALLTLEVPMAALPRAAADDGGRLDGSGFLVAPSEGMVLTACSWASSKWPHLARPGSVLLRASAGRSNDPRAFEMDDVELLASILGDLGSAMGLTGDPTGVRVSRWPRSLPQLLPGHTRRARGWAEALAGEHPGIALAGAGIGGIGIPACIRTGWAAADQVAGGRDDRSEPA